MECVFVLPVFLGALALLFAFHRVTTRLAEGSSEQQAGRAEVDKLDVWASAHGGILELPWRFLKPRTLDGARVACKVGERRVWVEVEGTGPFVVRAMVDVDHALDLEIRRPTFYRRRPGSARVSSSEIPSEEEQPDVRFDVRRAQDKTGELREKLFVHAGEALTVPLTRLLYQSTGADVVRASEGLLGVAFSVPSLVAQAVDEAVRDLVEIARAYSRKPVPLAIGTLVERYLWLEGNAPRCPYCHVDIVEGETDLAACDRCRTFHHAGCFAEHGGCTLLGCGGKATLPPGV